MALTGKFIADFESFFSACQKAEVSLRSFESGAGKVETSLNRMVDNFSGRKVIQDATLMVEAIERVGGTSKLTESELTRVGATAKEAADKMRAMGVDVPERLKQIAAGAKDTGEEVSTLTSLAKEAAAAFIAFFSIRAAANFVGDVIEQAGALKDLSAQTRINVRDIQILGGAMSEFGVDQETLARGLFRLSRQIAGGEDSVVDALHEMGLRLEDVAGLEGADLFLKIENGLASLKGNLRDTTAATLFGDRLGMAMAGASEGIQAAVDNARRLNTTMSEEAVDALDTYSEAIARAERNIAAMAANAIGPLAQGFNALNTAVDQGAGKWNVLWAVTKDWFESFSGGGTRHLATLLDELNQKTQQNIDQEKQAKTAHDSASEAILKAARAAEEYGPFLESAGNAAAWLAKQEEMATTAMKTHWDGVGEVIERVLGVTALRAATTWIDAINAMGGSVAQLTSVELANLQQAMFDGLDALARSGNATSSQANAFLEMAIQAGNAAAALRPVVTVTEDLAKAQYDYALAIDNQLAAQAAANQATSEMTAVSGAAKDSVLSLGSAASTAAQGFFQMSEGLYAAIRAAQSADELNKIVPAWGRIQQGSIGNPFPGPPPGIRPFAGGGPSVNVTNNITQPLGTPDQIARAVNDAVSQALRNRGQS